jgi:hypothetical protein
MAPDLRRKVDENRRARLASEEGMKRQQNAQVGFTVKPVSHHTSCISNVLAARPGVCETCLGRPTETVTVPFQLWVLKTRTTTVSVLGVTFVIIIWNYYTLFPHQVISGYMVPREQCYLGSDSFVDPQCHFQNPELFICAVTQSFICFCHDECTSGLLSPCQSLVLNDDIMELGNGS